MSEYSQLAPSCNLTCATYGEACTKKTVSRPGCYCKAGYVTDCSGKCAKYSEFCKTCKANEYFNECSSNPQPTCSDPNPKTLGREPCCICKDGYIRDGIGNCILKKDCPEGK